MLPKAERLLLSSPLFFFFLFFLSSLLSLLSVLYGMIFLRQYAVKFLYLLETQEITTIKYRHN